MTAEAVLFALLHCAVSGEKLDDRVKTVCTPELLLDVYTLAQKHDLAHLAGHILEQAKVPEAEAMAKFKNAKNRAIFRYLRLDLESQRVYAALEEAGIAFIPMKGAVLRSYYPEAWMRTSCDVDILIPEDKLAQTQQILEEKHGYVYKGKCSYHISLFSPNGLNLELHFQPLSQSRFAKARKVLQRMWEDAETNSNGAFQKVLSDEMFYFYHMAHMAVHIENGGCGIRPFLDVWILNHQVKFDRENRRKLLEEGSMLLFADAAEKLSECWFSGREMDPFSAMLENYVLRGGTYGTMENHVSLNQAKLGGKGRYAIRRIFLPYDSLKSYYPVLQKHKYLTPVFQVIRWIRLVFQGRLKRSVRELSMNASVSKDIASSQKTMLEYLGLLDN